MNIGRVTSTILQLHPENQIYDCISEAMHDYVSDDWEDEFDDIHEAYSEQGRGEAESLVLGEIIRKEYPGISSDDYVDLMQELADRLEISLD